MGSDILTIQVDASGCKLDQKLGGICRFYIGVHGYEDSSFVLTASLNFRWAEPLRLLPGKASSGVVNASTYDYYAFVVDQSALELRVTLTPLTVNSDPDLYVLVDQ